MRGNDDISIEMYTDIEAAKPPSIVAHYPYTHSMQPGNWDHPWLMFVRRQQRWMVASMVFAALIIIGVAIFVFRTLAGGPQPVNLFTLLAISIGMVLLLPLVLIWQMRATRRWAQKMVLSDGLLCPQCRRVLPAEVGQMSVKCASCDRTYQIAELRDFWGSALHEPMNAAQMWVEKFGGRGGRKWMATVFLPGQNRGMWGILAVVAWNALIWIGMGIAVSFFTGNSLLGGAIMYLHMMLLMTGFMIATTGWKARAGDSRQCAYCGYEQGPHATVPQRCPECGLDWKALGGTVKGKVKRSYRRLAAGVVLIALGGAALYRPVLGSNWQLKMLPTGSLISQTISVKGFTVNEWAELRTRTLSPKQERKLAEGLLEKRLRAKHPWFSADEDNWFAAQIAAGAFPEDLMLRYYREMLDINLEAPSEVRVGEEVSLRLRFTFRGGSTNNPRPDACISGFFVGDDPTPLARQEYALAGIGLDERTAGASVTRIAAQVTPREAGVLRVRVPVWLVYMAGGRGSQRITWSAEGEPSIPPTSAWHELRMIEHKIRVMP